MESLALSFLAGVLTVLAPCVLPLLPVIIGGSVVNGDRLRPFIIAGSLSISIVTFTLLLKATTFFIFIPDEVWKLVSGSIVLIFGTLVAFPSVWQRIETMFGLSAKSHKLLHKSSEHSGRWGAVLVGMSLGPVFSSCSPTYMLILATTLPQSFALGVANLLSYALGLSSILLLISFFGQSIVSKAKWLSDPNGAFKKILGIVLMIVGVGIIFGVDKKIEALLIL